MARVLILTFALLHAGAASAYAVQEHAGAEGFYAHQLAHLFLVAAMAYMFVALGKPAAARLSGWRYIRWGALVFLLWSAVAVISHMAENMLSPREAYIKGPHILLVDAKSRVYYFTRLVENFFLVPS